MKPDLHRVLENLRSALPEAIIELRKNPGPAGDDSLLVRPADLVAVCHHLRDVQGFDFLSCVTGIDWPDARLADSVAVPDQADDAKDTATGQPLAEAPAPVGFLEATYLLYATATATGPLILRARTGDRAGDVSIPSVTPIWKSADFQEREAYDLIGIHFTGHPDLRRILMWDEFVDHPLRKDYVAPDDYEYEPTPHDAVLERARAHYPAES